MKIRTLLKSWTARSIAAAVVVAGTAFAVFAMQSPANAACSQNPNNGNGFQSVTVHRGGAVNLRTGPSTSCGILGSINYGHSLYYMCQMTGDWISVTSSNGNSWGSSQWTYMYDMTLGVGGWATEVYLNGTQPGTCSPVVIG